MEQRAAHGCTLLRRSGSVSCAAVQVDCRALNKSYLLFVTLEHWNKFVEPGCGADKSP